MCDGVYGMDYDYLRKGRRDINEYCKNLKIQKRKLESALVKVMETAPLTYLEKELKQISATSLKASLTIIDSFLRLLKK